MTLLHLPLKINLRPTKNNHQPWENMSPTVFFFFIMTSKTQHLMVNGSFWLLMFTHLIFSFITLRQGYFMFHIIILFSLGGFIISLAFFSFTKILLQQLDKKFLVGLGWFTFLLFLLINLIVLHFHYSEIITTHHWPFG